jgi:hypothetical protein
MVNPDPAKGGQFFLNLVEQARVLAPGVRFRAVESRWGRADWAQRGMPAVVLDLVEAMPMVKHLVLLVQVEEAFPQQVALVPTLGLEL